MSFESLGLRAELLRAVSEQGYSEPTPIQEQAIPTILAGRDLLAGAQTGTGKTAGFTLPLLQRLLATPSAAGETKEKGWRPVRALILAPTRELAAQVRDSVATYGRYLPLRSTAVFGGVNIKPQIQNLRRGVDILVATPGRLEDHVQQRTVDLRNVEILVLDEADRMLDMGFLPVMKRIMALLPKQRQNLLLSATVSNEIRTLAQGLLRDPQLIQIARISSPAENVTQLVHPVDKDRRRELLAHLITEQNWRQVLVFTRMKFGAEKLANQLDRAGLQATAIHGNKNQNQRTRALADFKSGRVRVLVATDVASRGLDIEQLPHVVNYELPLDAESYVHRIGRTGRAGLKGAAVSLVSADEADLLADIERLIGSEIPRRNVPGFEPLAALVTTGAKGGSRGGKSRPGHHAHAPHKSRGEQKPHWHRRSEQKRGGRSRRGNSR
ncbi:MAG: DEAD/DEAH box helicase [Gammaproteobacteria bacterium]|nr:DEAD/DEAH box helicase [Gammaproteobacteria bacterium]